jgi:minor histocompatibility antigen H13
MDSRTLFEAAAQHFNDARPLMPMYLHLILSALFPIYTGAHASLSRPSSAAKSSKKDTEASTADEDEDKDEDEDEDEDEEDEDVVRKVEGLTPKDAIVFPVTAAIVLAGLYFLIKRYGADMVNLVLGVYFSGIGIYSVGKLVSDGLTILSHLIFPTYIAANRKLYKVDGSQRKAIAQDGSGEPYTFPSKLAKSWIDDIWDIRDAVKTKYRTKAFIRDVVDIKLNITPINLVAAAIGVAAIAYANLVAKPWYLTNLQGFAVCYNALQFMSPTTFATGALILVGLFCYDVWAVFFTPLMVTVAKNLDIPIKLVFPRPDEPSKIPGEPPVKSYSMLGLGDIVLPGIMTALALRFDLYMFYLKKQVRKDRAGTKKAGETKTNAKKANKKETEKTIEKPAGNDNEETSDELIKAPYVPMGTVGDRIWTSSLPDSAKPAKLRANFPKPYFTASMIGYVVGMLITLGVMRQVQRLREY